MNARPLGIMLAVLGVIMFFSGGAWIAFDAPWPFGFLIGVIGGWLLGVASMYLDPPTYR